MRPLMNERWDWNFQVLCRRTLRGVENLIKDMLIFIDYQIIKRF
jgi:hypothetical protein